MDSAPANTQANWIDSLKARVFSRGGLFVALVFLLAFIVRAQLMRYELFFEFDSYWHARMVSYILQGMGAQGIDPLGYYHNVAAATLGSVPIFFWYASATLYKIFTLNGAYNLETWILFVKILPALYGALTCVAMYFLGKEVFKGPHARTAGLLAGIFAAVVPSFVYRTMGGFFEDDSFGFLWMVMGFVFFVRALHTPAWKRENITNALLGGLSFGIMAVSWPGFNQLVPLLLGIGTMQFLIWLNEGEAEKAMNYARLWGIQFALLAIAATVQTGLFWLDQFGGIIGIVLRTSLGYVETTVFILSLFIVMGILYYLRFKTKIGPRAVKTTLYIGVLALVLAPLLVSVFNVSLQTDDFLGQSIGEESEGKNFFGNKYSLMFVFALIGIPLCGYLLWRNAKQYSVLVLPLVWTVVIFFMAWGKLKFTYYWGLPLALMGAVVIFLALQRAQKMSTRTQKFAVLAASLLILGSVAAGTLFVTQNTPNIESSPGWKTALFWANENLPADARLFNWWDEGHWISFLADRKVLIDNRNADPKASGSAALFLLSPSPSDAAKIVEDYNGTHLIFGDDLLSKIPSLGFYAYGITNGNDPRIQGYFGNSFTCSRTLAPITKELSYQCGGNTFTTQEMETFPTVWASAPNNLQNGTPFFIYRNPENSKIYFFTQRANDTMLVKLWFNQPEALEHFTPIYSNTGGVKLFEKG